MTKLAFVTPWYGENIPGGAEAETRRTAQQLQQKGFSVEILTSCIRDLYGDWGENYHKPGVENVNGIVVRRFPVQPRDRQAFDEVNWRLMNNLSISGDQEQTYITQMMIVPDLYDYIARHTQEYLFIFIPYMFATTYYGAQICPERSLIIPCLHDESYARLDVYQDVLPQAKGIILYTNAEYELFERLYGKRDDQIRAVLGAGVDTDFSAEGRRFRDKYGVTSPFLLYVGRREPGKNTPLLINYWERYQRQNNRDMSLVLIGPGEISRSFGSESNVIDLGFVPVQDKADALAAAEIFCMPSVNESFSIAVMESWLADTPVLVHGGCAVTREHCQRSNGGLYFTSFDEFAATLDFLLDHPQIAARMGRQGHQYVLDNFQWSNVVDRYAQLLKEVEIS